MTSASRLKKPAAIFPIMAGGLGLTFAFVLGYKFLINPYLAKKKRAQSQSYAESLWEMQHVQKSDSES